MKLAALTVKDKKAALGMASIYVNTDNIVYVVSALGEDADKQTSVVLLNGQSLIIDEPCGAVIKKLDALL